MAFIYFEICSKSLVDTPRQSLPYRPALPAFRSQQKRGNQPLQTRDDRFHRVPAIRYLCQGCSESRLGSCDPILAVRTGQERGFSSSAWSRRAKRRGVRTGGRSHLCPGRDGPEAAQGSGSPKAVSRLPPRFHETALMAGARGHVAHELAQEAQALLHLGFVAVTVYLARQ